MNWLPLFSLLAGLASNKYVKSALISLAGVIGAAITQSATGQDLSGTGAAIAAGVSAWLANILKDLAPLLLAWLQAKLSGQTPAPIDLGGLDQLSEDHDAPDPPATPRLMRDEIPFALLWLVPLLWFGCQMAQAAPPVAIINGPTTAVPGELIVLDASQSDGEPTHFSWRISPELKGRKQISPIDGGRKLQMASFAGRYLVTLVCSNADGNDILAWQVDVPGTPPCPSPEPQPVAPQPIPVDPAPPRPPAPEPVIPTPPPAPQPVTPTPPAPSPGRFGIGARVRAAVLGVSSPTRAAEVAKLRVRLTDLKAQGAAGSLNAQQFLDALVGELKLLPDSWQVVKTLAALGIRVLVTGGQLKTVDDFIDLAAEILQAIEGL